MALEMACWMDNGEMKKIWYIADNMGFRAFGDVIPSTDWPETEQESMPTIGSSIVQPVPVAGGEHGETEDSQSSTQPKIPAHLSIPEESSLSESSGTNETTTEESSPISPTSEGSATDGDGSKPDAPLQVTDSSKTVETVVETDKQASPQVVDTPSVIPGTSFVLLSSIRLPIQKSVAPKASQIKPRPVEVTGVPATPIRGILSDPRAINVLDHRKAKNLGSVSAQTEKQVPRPSKVEGVINMDNYLRPAYPTTSNLKGGRSTHDYYYDDYYYDHKPTTTKKESLTTAATKSRRNKQRSVRSQESSESFEDFDYAEDSSDEKRRRKRKSSV